MKRAVIRSSAMALVVLAFAIGINAQSSQQYRAEIPFSFEADGRQYSAGQYRLGAISSGAIGLLNIKNGKMRVLGIASLPGNNKWDGRGTVTFLRLNGKYRMTEISTSSFGLKMKVKRTREHVGDIALAQQVVKINLN